MTFARKSTLLFACLGVLAYSVAVVGQEDVANVQLKALTLSKSGSLKGRITTAMSSFDAATPAAAVRVMLSRNGKNLAQAQTDKYGRFEIKDVHTGRYNILAIGETALLASGVNVVENDGTEAVAELVAMPAPHKVAKSVLQANSKSLLESPPVKMFERLDSPKVLTTSMISPTLTEGTISGLISDLGGNSAEAKVFLIQGDKIVKETISVDGRYTLNDVKAGVYSLMAVAQNGFSVAGVQVKKLPPVTRVSLVVQDGADITLAEGQTFRLYVQDEVDDDNDDGAPAILPDGGFVPGDGGVTGGGGVGFGGAAAGLGGLAGLAGLAALGDDNASPK